MRQTQRLKRSDSNNYRQIFLSGAPMIDLRAPCEFSKGAFPNAINYPLLNDSERQQVGVFYKEKGQQSAIELGHKLVSGELKESRIATWCKYLRSHPDRAYIYCFRGGLRSRISKDWISEAGVDIPIIEGGYKAMRQFLIEETARIVNSTKTIIVSGLTGTAKTKLLETQKNAIDLEAMANHRGSSFGRRMTPQPSQINFENNLAISLLKHEEENKTFLLLEDEGRLIGARSLPLVLKNRMDNADIVLLEESFNYRLNQIYEDYVVSLYKEICVLHGNKSLAAYNNFLTEALAKIKKRLGNTRYLDASSLIENAIVNQEARGDFSKHKDWIKYLLVNYYDPMYDFQMENKKRRIKFTGCTSEVIEYLAGTTGK